MKNHRSLLKLLKPKLHYTNTYNKHSQSTKENGLSQSNSLSHKISGLDSKSEKNQVLISTTKNKIKKFQQKIDELSKLLNKNNVNPTMGSDFDAFTQIVEKALEEVSSKSVQIQRLTQRFQDQNIEFQNQINMLMSVNKKLLKDKKKSHEKLKYHVLKRKKKSQNKHPLKRITSIEEQLLKKNRLSFTNIKESISFGISSKKKREKKESLNKIGTFKSFGLNYSFSSEEEVKTQVKKNKHPKKIVLDLTNTMFPDFKNLAAFLHTNKMNKYEDPLEKDTQKKVNLNNFSFSEKSPDTTIDTLMKPWLSDSILENIKELKTGRNEDVSIEFFGDN